MGAERIQEMEGVETLGKYVVEYQEGLGVIPRKEGVHETETVFVIEFVEVAHHIFVADIAAAEGYRLVEDGERVAHRAVSLAGDDVERLLVNVHALA